MTTTTSSYVGQQTCDLRPDWIDTDPDLRALLDGCFYEDPEDLTSHLVLADWLQEHNDPREVWVRTAVEMWKEAARLVPDSSARVRRWLDDELRPFCRTTAGCRLAGLWGCLVAWFAPAADDVFSHMGRTWVDARVLFGYRYARFWALGFLPPAPRLVHQSMTAAYDSAADACYGAGDFTGLAYAALHQADVVTRLLLAPTLPSFSAGLDSMCRIQGAAAWYQVQNSYGFSGIVEGKTERASTRVVNFAESCWDAVCAPRYTVLSTWTAG